MGKVSNSMHVHVTRFRVYVATLSDGNERAACNNRVTRSPADHFHLRTFSTSIFPTETSPIPFPCRSFPLSGRISSGLATDTTFRQIESTIEDMRSDYSLEEELRSDNCAYMENYYHLFPSFFRSLKTRNEKETWRWKNNFSAMYRRCLPGDIEVAGHIDCSCGLVTGNSSDQGHSGRFIDASRYIHGVTRVNHSHRGHEKQGS